MASRLVPGFIAFSVSVYLPVQLHTQIMCCQCRPYKDDDAYRIEGRECTHDRMNGTHAGRGGKRKYTDRDKSKTCEAEQGGKREVR